MFDSLSEVLFKRRAKNPMNQMVYHRFSLSAPRAVARVGGAVGIEISPLRSMTSSQIVKWPVLNNCLRGILVVPFVAAGIALAASHMDSKDFEHETNSTPTRL
jgi:hypothetical protein